MRRPPAASSRCRRALRQTPWIDPGHGRADHRGSRLTCLRDVSASDFVAERSPRRRPGPTARAVRGRRNPAQIGDARAVGVRPRRQAATRGQEQGRRCRVCAWSASLTWTATTVADVTRRRGSDRLEIDATFGDDALASSSSRRNAAMVLQQRLADVSGRRPRCRAPWPSSRELADQSTAARSSATCADGMSASTSPSAIRGHGDQSTVETRGRGTVVGFGPAASVLPREDAADADQGARSTERPPAAPPSRMQRRAARSAALAAARAGEAFSHEAFLGWGDARAYRTARWQAAFAVARSTNNQA